MNNNTLIQYFEWDLPANASLWKNVTYRANTLKDNGFTGVWLPPAYKGMNGINDVGYGTYDLYDLGEFNQKGSIPTKYGTKKEYLAAVAALQKCGLKVYADIVLNHKMGADELEEVDAVEASSDNHNDIISNSRVISAWTKFTFPGRDGKYSSFVWNKSHFSGTDWDDKEKKQSLFLFEGKNWNTGTDDEHGNYDYLMGVDLDMDNPEVMKELLKWGLWYESLVHMDGFRLDAVKHIDSSFYTEWIKSMRLQSGKELPCIGEYWSNDINHLINYLDAVKFEMALFDVPLHFNMYRASISEGNYDMAKLFDNTLISMRPNNSITFVDNHDTQPGQALYSYVASWFKPIAYAIILLRKYGTPCVFYGDYYGLKKSNVPPVPYLDRLIKIRELYAYGEENLYTEDENIIGFTRLGDSRHSSSGLACIVSDGAGGSKTMNVGIQHAGRVMLDATMQCPETVTVDDEGNASFRVEGGSVSVWVFEPAYEYIVTHYN